LLPAAAIGLALGASQAMADTIVTFGTETNQAFIDNYFNGGVDSQGRTGTNFGVVFGSNAESLKAGFSGTGGTGTGKFENLPSGAPGILLFAPAGTNNPSPAAPANTINIAGGFTSLSFNYSLLNNTAADGSVEDIWSGLNGTGTLLRVISLSAAATSVACTNSHDEFCTWSAASLAGFGTGKSITFTGNAQGLTEFDHLDFTAAAPVPLPAALWLLISGMGGIAGFARRRKSVA
jgi:hypothetical protein